MHSYLLTAVVLGLAVAAASPVRPTTSSQHTSQKPLQAKILPSAGFKLAPENKVNGGVVTTASTNSDWPKTIEITTGSDKTFTKDFTSVVRRESSVSPLTKLFRQLRSVTTESTNDTTAAPFVLDFQALRDGQVTAMIFQNNVKVMIDDLESEVDFSFSTIQTVAILNRPVMETNLKVDSAACVNIQDVIIEMIEILDAFKPYVEAIGNPYITEKHLRANLHELVSSVVIPTSGSQTTVTDSTQETIYTLIALEYQLQIIHEVISNLLNCQ